MKDKGITNRHAGKILWDILSVLSGAVLFAMSVNLFYIPGNIVLGGATGIATLAHYFFGWRIGAVIMAVNIPLILINARLYGMRFCVRTLIGTAATSVLVDTLDIFPVTITDPLLCAVFGAIAMGAGCGIMFTRGYTTGGTDLVAWWVRYYRPHFSVGKLITAIDFMIILAAALLLRSFESIFYSVITIYLFGHVVDYILSGYAREKLIWIISDKYRQLAGAVTDRMGHGVTILHGYGWYTGEEKQVMLCAVRKNELFSLKELVRSIDSGAFMMISEATEIYGEGFGGESSAAPANSSAFGGKSRNKNSRCR